MAPKPNIYNLILLQNCKCLEELSINLRALLLNLCFKLCKEFNHMFTNKFVLQVEQQYHVALMSIG